MTHDNQKAKKHFILGGVYMSHGNLRAAEHEFKQAVKLNPCDWLAYYALGVCCGQEQKLRDASNALEKAAALNPDNLDIMLALAHAAIGLNEKTRAAEILERALVLSPGNPQALSALDAMRQAAANLEKRRRESFREAILIADEIFIMIRRKDVEYCDVKAAAVPLNELLTDAAVVRKFKGKIEPAVDGYNDDPRPLHEIDEVRIFLKKLDEEFPYWFWFLNAERAFLRALFFCLCETGMKSEGIAFFKEDSIRKFLDKHYSALEVLGTRFNLSRKEIESRVNEVESFFNDNYYGSIIGGSAKPVRIEGLFRQNGKCRTLYEQIEAQIAKLFRMGKRV